MGWRRLIGGLVVATFLASCSQDDAPPVARPKAAGEPSVARTDPTTTTAAASTTTSSTPATTPASPDSTTTTTTTTTSTAAAPITTVLSATDVAGLATDALQVVEIGRSVEGRPITAVQRGTAGGTVVLVIGVIHGDEDDGVAIVRELATVPVPAGIDLWLVESINPDGQAAGRRTNANLVDLNRNFPFDWAPLGAPGDPEFGGAGPASEPETQAMVELISAIRPRLGIWYHQDLFRIAPGQGRDGELRSRYAELTGLPVLGITGGTYTGVAATWQRRTVEDGVAFIVELGPTLSADEAVTHAAAVLSLAVM